MNVAAQFVEHGVEIVGVVMNGHSGHFAYLDNAFLNVAHFCFSGRILFFQEILADELDSLDQTCDCCDRIFAVMSRADGCGRFCSRAGGCFCACSLSVGHYDSNQRGDAAGCA